MNNGISDLIREKGKWLLVYRGIETTDDPYEKNKTVTLLPPLPVRAIVEDLTATQANWKMPGVLLKSAKVIYCEKKYRKLLELSQQIGVKNELKEEKLFEGWRVNGQMQIKETGDFLELNIYSKTA